MNLSVKEQEGGSSTVVESDEDASTGTGSPSSTNFSATAGVHDNSATSTLPTTKNVSPESISVKSETTDSLAVPELPTSAGESYTQERALDDLPGISYALALFLSSHMVESEEFCHERDPKKCVTIS